MAKVSVPHMQRWAVGTFVRNKLRIDSGAVLTVASPKGDSMTISRSLDHKQIVVMTIRFTECPDPIRLTLDTSEDLWRLLEYTGNDFCKPEDDSPYVIGRWIVSLGNLLLQKGFGESQVVSIIHPSQNWMMRQIQSLFYRF